MAHSLTHSAAPTGEPGSLAAARRSRLVVGGATALLLVCAGAARGGYFPGSWGWLTVACAWAALLALVLDADAAVGRAAAATLAALAAFAGWTLLSAAWSVDVTATVLEAQRTLVYVAGLGAAILLARRAPAALLGGVVVAATALCAYALATRLLPDRFGVVDAIGGYRLSEPIGYWNSLGMLAGVGALLALALAARTRSVVTRAAAAAPLPLLVSTLYFTYSRGAWGSCALGLLAGLAVDKRRLQALVAAAVLAPWPALAVLLASRSHPLTTLGSPLAEQAHAGHRLALLLVALCSASAACAAALAMLTPRATFAQRLARPTEIGLAVAAVAAAIAVCAAYGAPWRIASHAWNGFASAPPATGADLNARLFHLSGSGRLTQWKVAWREVKAHPVLGSGAATYERYWNRYRPQAGKVRNVHNLYLEALATLGPLGLALLAAALAIPLVAAVRRRGQPLVPLVLAAYVAYLLHAIVDWDWQIASVTMVALCCAATFVTGGAARPLPRRARIAGAALAAVAAAFGLYGIAAQTTLARIESATPAKAASAARRAADLQPWSTEPWSRLALVEMNVHRYAEARAALRRALAKDRGDWQLWLDLAESSNGTERASALARAAALNPYSPEVKAFRQTLVSLSTLAGAK